MPKACIIDIDGTLADCSHRIEYALNSDWDTFQSLSPLDTPVQPIIDIAWSLRSSGWLIILCTGRNERYHTITREWLLQHKVPYDLVVYRENGNFEKDCEYKRRKLKEIREKFPEHNFCLAIEDRDRVVKMWREEGLVCLQAQEGAY